MPKQLHIFATRYDILSVVYEIEAQHKIKYVEIGLFEEQDRKVYYSADEIDDFGVAKVPRDANPEYLVADIDKEVRVRAVPQRKGGVKYAVDQLANPASIVLGPGGVFENHCVIAGRIGTCSDDPDSLVLLNMFVRVVRRQFSKIRADYVGKRAENLFDNGFRLTNDVRRAVDYDLSRP